MLVTTNAFVPVFLILESMESSLNKLKRKVDIPFEGIRITDPNTLFAFSMVC